MPRILEAIYELDKPAHYRDDNLTRMQRNANSIGLSILCDILKEKGVLTEPEIKNIIAGIRGVV